MEHGGAYSGAGTGGLVVASIWTPSVDVPGETEYVTGHILTYISFGSFSHWDMIPITV